MSCGRSSTSYAGGSIARCGRGCRPSGSSSIPDTTSTRTHCTRSSSPVGSNKDFIGEVLDRERTQRIEGSLAAMVVCIMKRARIVRMHNVAASVAAVRMTEAILGFREPAYLLHNTHPTLNV